MQKERTWFHWISAVVKLSPSDRWICGSTPGSATIEKKTNIVGYCTSSHSKWQCRGQNTLMCSVNKLFGKGLNVIQVRNCTTLFNMPNKTL